MVLLKIPKSHPKEIYKLIDSQSWKIKITWNWFFKLSLYQKNNEAIEKFGYFELKA